MRLCYQAIRGYYYFFYFFVILKTNDLKRNVKSSISEGLGFIRSDMVLIRRDTGVFIEHYHHVRAATH